MTYEFESGYRIRDQSAWHFLTFTLVDWIDLFSRDRYRDILLNNMAYCRANKGLCVAGYVIMSNHMHVIWRAQNDNLSDIVRDFKSYSTKQIIDSILDNPESRREWLLHKFGYHAAVSSIHKRFKIWLPGNHPEVIYSSDFFLQKLNYIHMNPVRAKIVEDPCHYLYSSASNYATGKGLIEIDCLV